MTKLSKKNSNRPEPGIPRMPFKEALRRILTAPAAPRKLPVKKKSPKNR